MTYPNQCAAVLNLYGTDDQCIHPSGHLGPHYSEAWNPGGISWTGGPHPIVVSR